MMKKKILGSGAMIPVKIAKNIYWVGGIDWDLRNFHGYVTQKGSTYNAYLVIDEKIALIDTVKHYHYEEMIERISKVIDPSKINYIISNHVEMDHSGSIPLLKKIAPHAAVYASPNGVKGLTEHYKSDLGFKQVKTGDTLKLGKYSLRFILTPMVHWPDNMMTYLPEEKILFSNDAFGQHIASYDRFDDEHQLNMIMQEAAKYYANIVMPYSEQVKSALSDAAKLDIEIIAPSHGLIWRKHINEIIHQYEEWSGNLTKNKCVIIFDTMWNSTKKIAYAIQSAFESRDFETEMLNLQTNHISDIMTELLNAKYICVGSPTLNNNMLPTVSAFLTYLKGLAPKNRFGLAFGSYGWGGQSIGQVEDTLASCGFEMLESIKIKYVPEKNQLAEIINKLEGLIK